MSNHEYLLWGWKTKFTCHYSVKSVNEKLSQQKINYKPKS